MTEGIQQQQQQQQQERQEQEQLENQQQQLNVTSENNNNNNNNYDSDHKHLNQSNNSKKSVSLPANNAARRWSCELCRSRKIKCDGVRPSCRFCTKRGMADQCVFLGAKDITIHVPKRRRNNNNSSTQVSKSNNIESAPAPAVATIGGGTSASSPSIDIHHQPLSKENGQLNDAAVRLSNRPLVASNVAPIVNRRELDGLEMDNDNDDVMLPQHHHSNRHLPSEPSTHHITTHHPQHHRMQQYTAANPLYRDPSNPSMDPMYPSPINSASSSHYPSTPQYPPLGFDRTHYNHPHLHHHHHSSSSLDDYHTHHHHPHHLHPHQQQPPYHPPHNEGPTPSSYHHMTPPPPPLTFMPFAGGPSNSSSSTFLPPPPQLQHQHQLQQAQQQDVTPGFVHPAHVYPPSTSSNNNNKRHLEDTLEVTERKDVPPAAAVASIPPPQAAKHVGVTTSAKAPGAAGVTTNLNNAPATLFEPLLHQLHFGPSVLSSLFVDPPNAIATNALSTLSEQQQHQQQQQLLQQQQQEANATGVSSISCIRDALVRTGGLPGEERIMVDNYFQLKPLVDFLHKRTFVLNIEHAHPFLRLAVMAAGAMTPLTAGFDRSALFWYYERARAFASEVVHHPSIEVLQGLLVLCHTSAYLGNKSAAFTHLGMACRMATYLQLDMEPPANLTWLERETRRRCWWACYLFDRFVSVLWVEPVILPSNGCSTGPICPEELWASATNPSTIEDLQASMRITGFSMNPAMYLVRLADLFAQIYPRTPLPSDFANAFETMDALNVAEDERLYNELLTWHEALPIHYRVCLTLDWVYEEINNHSKPSAVTIALFFLYHGCITMLMRRRTIMHLLHLVLAPAPSSSSSSATQQNKRGRRRTASSTTRLATSTSSSLTAPPATESPLTAMREGMMSSELETSHWDLLQSASTHSPKIEDGSGKRCLEIGLDSAKAISRLVSLILQTYSPLTQMHSLCNLFAFQGGATLVLLLGIARVLPGGAVAILGTSGGGSVVAAAAAASRKVTSPPAPGSTNSSPPGETTSARRFRQLSGASSACLDANVDPQVSMETGVRDVVSFYRMLGPSWPYGLVLADALEKLLAPDWNFTDFAMMDPQQSAPPNGYVASMMRMVSTSSGTTMTASLDRNGLAVSALTTTTTTTAATPASSAVAGAGGAGAMYVDPAGHGPEVHNGKRRLKVSSFLLKDILATLHIARAVSRHPNSSGVAPAPAPTGPGQNFLLPNPIVSGSDASSGNEPSPPIPGSAAATGNHTPSPRLLPPPLPPSLTGGIPQKRFAPSDPATTLPVPSGFRLFPSQQRDVYAHNPAAMSSTYPQQQQQQHQQQQHSHHHPHYHQHHPYPSSSSSSYNPYRNPENASNMYSQAAWTMTSSSSSAGGPANNSVPGGLYGESNPAGYAAPFAHGGWMGGDSGMLGIMTMGGGGVGGGNGFDPESAVASLEWLLDVLD